MPLPLPILTLFTGIIMLRQITLVIVTTILMQACTYVDVDVCDSNITIEANAALTGPFPRQ